MHICGNRDYTDGVSFSKNLMMRMWVHWCLKAVGTILFTVIFFKIYFYLLKNSFFTITLIPLCIVDQCINFQPYFLYVYLSLWIYVSLVPALMSNKKELFYYGIYIALLCFVGIVIYVIFPTIIPQSGINWNLYPEFAFLKTVDSAGNAFPSMHVATALFSFFWLHRMLKQMSAPKFLLWINLLWCLAIIYSTMAIKQHLFLDVFGGLILGGIFSLLTLKYHSRKF
jgi:membrane-associated phospholipid phosphatase